jgi:putative hemolysin
MNNLSTLTVKEQRKLSFVRSLFKPKRRKPHIDIEIKKGSFLVKTASSKEELSQAYRLRHDVFYTEFSGKSNALGLDQDRFDKYADVLVIIDLERKKVIGTYRVICSKFAKRFYSSSEFYIKKFLAEDGVKVELSRACIDKDYRNGTAIRLLWRGIYQYLSMVDARYLFGCSSVSGLSSDKILSLMHYIHKHGLTVNQWEIEPRYTFDHSLHLLKAFGGFQEGNPLDHMPALFRAYLNAGAKFEAVPAYDTNFSCYDFFTVLDVKELRQSHTRTLGAL